MAQYELNLVDYWFIIRKQRYTIVLTTVLVVGLTFAFTEFLQPDPIYEATARVKFDRTSNVANLLLESFTLASGNDLETQTEVVRSFPVIQQVAQELNLVPPNPSPETLKSASFLTTIYDLQGRIGSSLEGATSIIRISARAGDPDTAARMANATAEAYRRENIKARNRMVNESRRFVEEQLDLLIGRLKEAEEALRRFKEREGQVFLDEEAKAALEHFTSLEAEANRFGRLKAEAERQIKALRQGGGSGPIEEERIFTEEPSTLLSVLNRRLLDLQQEREVLLINYTPLHLQVKELDRKIENVKDEMVLELESMIKSLSDRQATLQKQIEAYRARYLSFPKAALELARLEREVKVNADLYAGLKSKHQELMIKGAEKIEEVTIIEPAIPPAVPVNAAKTGLNLFIGTLMGAFLGLVLAFMRESFDTSIGTIEGVEEYLKLPVLGVIPAFSDKDQREAAAKALPTVSPEAVDIFSRLVCLYDPKSILSEGYRSFRTNMQFACRDQNIKTVLFTSAGLGEGKTTTVVNLALTFAQDGKRILLVDADLRRPIINRRLGLPREPGLTDVLVGTIPWRTAVRTVTDLMLGPLGVDHIMNNPALDNFNVLTSGAIPPNPGEFLSSPNLLDLLAEFREEYDLVLVDAPPILPIADAITMSSRMDTVILVYQVGKIGRSALKRAKFLLDHAGAKMLGIVLTNVRAEFTPEYGYYRYEYR